MVVHYNPRLREKIPALAGDAEITVHSAFREFEEVIVKHLSPPPKGSQARSRSYQQLLKQSCEHAQAYQRPYGAESTIIFVHPLYLPLTHMGHIKRSGVQEAEAYLDRFFGFLHSNPDRSKVGIVVLETAHHYAAATSCLLEQGLVDRVIFTGYDNGHPLTFADLYPFASHTLFFAGGYNDRCLGGAIESMEDIASRKQFWAISDLTLISPLDSATGSLQPTSVFPIPRSRFVSLEKAVGKLGL